MKGQKRNKNRRKSIIRSHPATASKSNAQPLEERFASELRRLRAAKRITVEELARKTKITPAFVRKVESGELSKLPLTKAQALAKALGVDVKDLLVPGGSV